MRVNDFQVLNALVKADDVYSDVWSLGKGEHEIQSDVNDIDNPIKSIYFECIVSEVGSYSHDPRYDNRELISDIYNFAMLDEDGDAIPLTIRQEGYIRNYFECENISFA